MTMGGATYTDNPLLKKIMLSMRDCWCESGCRFSQSLPKGYDHKYVYSQNLRYAVGVAQLEKFPSFVIKRKENQKKLYDGLKDLQLVETQTLAGLDL